MESARILLVEDDIGIQEALKEFLTMEGHTVETASNGREALDKLEALKADPTLKPYPLIILDLMMPVMSGWEFMTHRASVPEFSRIPVITCSAAENPPAWPDHMRKPLDLDQFVALVEKKLA